jgi:hypothetical protein
MLAIADEFGGVAPRLVASLCEHDRRARCDHREKRRPGEQIVDPIATGVNNDCCTRAPLCEPPDDSRSASLLVVVQHAPDDASKADEGKEEDGEEHDGDDHER